MIWLVALLLCLHGGYTGWATFFAVLLFFYVIGRD